MTTVLQAQELQKAIRSGNVDKAVQMARVLALVKAPVIVKFGVNSPDEADETSLSIVRLRVYFEEYDDPNPLMVNPKMTFGDLKFQIYEQYRMDPTDQVLITGNDEPNDGDSLEQHGLCTDNAQLFVYSLNAAKLDTEELIDLVDEHSKHFAGSSGGPDRSQCLQKIVEHVTADLGLQSPRLPQWSCSACTYQNHHALENCELCDTARSLDADGMPKEGLPAGAEASKVTDPAKKARSSGRIVKKGYNDLVAAEFAPMIKNSDPFECPICFTAIESGEGVTLRECLHNFCVTCLEGHITHCENAVVRCPFTDDNYRCQSALQDREIRALVSGDVYEQYLRMSCREAEGQSTHSFHCKTPDCPGWCIVEDNATEFFCYSCNHTNCISCRIIHEGQVCDEYQKQVNEEARLKLLKELGDALLCPTCQTVITKADGCDWICCAVCKTEICWATKQARWGPKGKGDTSGGCRCRVNGVLCHPKCQNCH